MKYKLIKLYPNSPEIGTIVQKVKSGNGYGWNNEGPYDSRLFTNKTVEHYPEFWEEVKEKEYTILGFTSVRRERDGEVFTLGDKIVSTKESYKSINVTIKNFEFNKIADGGIYLCDITEGIALNAAQKAPIRKPILVTEDGVEIFEGDNFSLFSVCTKANWQETRYTAIQTSYLSKEWKHFHTKEAREEYIKWNKPMYSLNDINKANNKSLMENKDLIKVIQELDRK